MVSQANETRLLRLQEKRKASPTGSGVAIRRPDRRLSLTLLYFSTISSIVTSVAYLLYRLTLSIQDDQGSFTVWIVLLVEILTTCKPTPLETCILILNELAVPKLFAKLSVVSASGRAEGDRNVQTVEGSRWPAVDILVTYCGEGDEMVLNTAKAACACDYPPGLVRVIILDDSRSRKLAQRVEEMKKQWPSLSYASRNVEVKTHSKASNLNFGLKYLESLKGGRASHIAVLDADMIPEPQWLRCVLPHVLNNPRAALACPFQRYYNVSEGDPLAIKTDFQRVECMMHLQDFSNNSACTGSGFVVSSSALETIGGFPEDSLQEDILTSAYLSAAGWCSVYVPESVQWGLGPETMSAYIKQRQRWAVGVVTVAHFVHSGKAKELPEKERLKLTLWGIVAGCTPFIWTFDLVVLPLCMLTRKSPIIPSQHVGDLRLLLRLAAIDFGAQTMYHIFASSVLDFRMPIHGLSDSVWIQPWRLSALLHYFVIPKLFGRDLPNFTPTGTSASGDAERAARAKRSPLACCKVVLWDCGAWTHLIIFLFCTIGAVTWLNAALEDYHSNMGARNVALMNLRGIAWPPLLLLWAALAKAAWLPISYAIRPPSLSARETLMTLDPKRGVEYPSDDLKKEYLQRPSQWPFVFKCLVYISALVVMEML